MVDRLTHKQALVLSLLEQENAPLSAYTILDKLRNDGFRAPLQVYRALEKLILLNKIHRLESVNAFMACTQPDNCEHDLTAFAICEVCHQANELEDHSLAHNIKTMTNKIGFNNKHSTIEIRGICHKCMVNF